MPVWTKLLTYRSVYWTHLPYNEQHRNVNLSWHISPLTELRTAQGLKETENKGRGGQYCEGHRVGQKSNKSCYSQSTLPNGWVLNVFKLPWSWNWLEVFILYCRRFERKCCYHLQGTSKAERVYAWYQAPAGVYMKSALYWVLTQRKMLKYVSGHIIGPIFMGEWVNDHWMWDRYYTENYHCMLREMPD